MLALASIVILGSESHGTHDHILLSDSSGPRYIASGQTTQKTPPPTSSSIVAHVSAAADMRLSRCKPVVNNFFWLRYSGFQVACHDMYCKNSLISMS
jgi:hypothetical protein